MSKLAKAIMALVGVCLCWLVGTESVCAQDQAAKKTAAIESFQLYYGGAEDKVSSVVDDIAAKQLVVVDVRSLSDAQLEKLKASSKKAKAKLIVYISIGELHSREMDLFETFVKTQDPKLDFANLKTKLFLGDNTVFSSHYVDVANPMWRKFVFSKAKDILAKGVDGLFLDTVDTADLYCLKEDWDWEHRSKSVTAMISLIREIKQNNAGILTLQNRGLNLIGKQVFVADSNGKITNGLSLAEPHDHNPDVILFENAFNSKSDWAMQVVKNLEAIQQSGEATVVALGYEDVIKDKASFEEQCVKHEFVPAWASNSESLHLEVAK